jgi:hypothetical protein
MGAHLAGRTRPGLTPQPLARLSYNGLIAALSGAPVFPADFSVSE